MSDLIKLLPDSVANQIAAGEVIQRPASVVKELVENSVDAGATNIKVIVKDSGRTLIQIIDNGSGMSETDARLAFERHATSKITSAQDLFAISTKGFRGEALASIAAVAMVELKTRRPGDESGTLIKINGSKVESQEICSCPSGSSFSVKNLFYNVPARRKFLKSDATEQRHIINEFQKIVLGHPQITFSLYHNDTEIYNLLSSNLRQRIVAVFGKNINQDLITVDTDTSLINISGFIGKPENARRTFGEQFFFVNDRFIKHPYFHKAVLEAYHNILPAETIPSYFIYLKAEPSGIDINIHPTKTEVKFEDERAIWQILLASVREALGRFNIVPSLDFENEALVDIPVRSSSGRMPEAPVIEINREYNPFEGEERGTRAETIRHFEREKTEGWEKMYPAPGTENKTSPATENPEVISRKLFQIKGKFIICPVKSGLMIIDQKRAHERILFEKFHKNLDNNKSIGQTTLFPVTVEINPEDMVLVNDIGHEFSLLGFDIRDLGNNVISINSIPADSDSSNPAEIFLTTLGLYKDTESDPVVSRKEKIAMSMARASAIPYGKTLSQSEMENLFDELFGCASPNYSPTGKPVINIITLEEIDKRFK
jgi:DNA mismatch repair protein MutL